MDKINEEKYISIEYETWNNKYLPMEQELRRVIAELEESKIRVKIELKTYHPYLKKYYIDEIGYVDYGVGKGWKVQIDDFKSVQSKINSALLDCHHTESKFFSINHVLSIEHQIQKIESMIEQREQKYNRIPKWIRKIFGV